MRKAYENNDLMMYVCKRYCCRCGGVLKRKKSERIVKKGDPEHTKEYWTINDDILVIGREYYCPSCRRAYSCDTQGKVMEAQKYYQRNIVSEGEIALAEKILLRKEVRQILRCRWLLLLPGLGSLICLFMITSTRLYQLSRNINPNNLIWIWPLVFSCVGMILKIVLGYFEDVEFIRAYQTLIIVVSGLYAVNIPTLWYINRTFNRSSNT